MAPPMPDQRHWRVFYQQHTGVYAVRYIFTDVAILYIFEPVLVDSLMYVLLMILWLRCWSELHPL